MYDTVKLWLDTSETGRLETVLADFQERVDPKTGDLKQWGNLKSLGVRAGNRGIVVEGSLPKYHFGNNLESMTRRATKEAIESISDALHLPIEQARVCRLDIAENFIMKRPVVDYLSTFLTARYYKRSDIADRGTVSFNNGLRMLCFYDKARELKRELKKNKQVIPDDFKGKNILRYECRFIKRLGNQFGKKIVTAENLYDEIFYSKPVKKWNEEYFLIQKITKKRALSMNGQKKYLESLAFYGLQNIGGADVALDLIKGAWQRGEIDKNKRGRLRKLTIHISQPIASIELPSDDCIQELDDKIRQTADSCR